LLLVVVAEVLPTVAAEVLAVLDVFKCLFVGIQLIQPQLVAVQLQKVQNLMQMVIKVVIHLLQAILQLLLLEVQVEQHKVLLHILVALVVVDHIRMVQVLVINLLLVPHKEILVDLL
jgi:hypothetical protein